MSAYQRISPVTQSEASVLSSNSCALSVILSTDSLVNTILRV